MLVFLDLHLHHYLQGYSIIINSLTFEYVGFLINLYFLYLKHSYDGLNFK